MADASSVRMTNQVLAALPLLEWRRLEPHLDLVELPTGAMLYESGVVLQHVYFPATAVVSLVSSMQDGTSVEVAVVGSEGIVGVCAFMGGGHALSGAVVQSPGHALRMPARSIAWHANRSEALMQQLLCYTQALFTHMAQTSACNRHHALDQRTMFVNIQHPGESTPYWNDLNGGAPTTMNPSTVSNWPYGNQSNPRRPRPATVVIRRQDGGRIGE